MEVRHLRRLFPAATVELLAHTLCGCPSQPWVASTKFLAKSKGGVQFGKNWLVVWYKTGGFLIRTTHSTLMLQMYALLIVFFKGWGETNCLGGNKFPLGKVAPIWLIMSGILRFCLYWGVREIWTHRKITNPACRIQANRQNHWICCVPTSCTQEEKKPFCPTEGFCGSAP